MTIDRTGRRWTRMSGVGPLVRGRRWTRAVVAATVASALLGASVSGSAAEPVWIKTLGGPGGSSIEGLAPAPDGGVFATVLPAFYSDVRSGLRRFSSTGKQLWSRPFPKGSVPWVGDLASDASGAYLSFREEGVFGEDATHYALRKYRNDGSIAWTVRWVGYGAPWTEMQGYPAVAVQGGTAYVFYDPKDQTARAVARFDVDDGQRAADWQVPVLTAYPSSSWLATDLAATPDGLYALTWFVGAWGEFDASDQLQVDRITPGGTVAWSRTIRKAVDLSAVSIDGDAAGAVVTWYRMNNHGDEVPSVTRYRVDGERAWTHGLPPYGSAPAIGNGSTVWAVHHRYDSSASSDVLVRRISSTGATQREARFGTSWWEAVTHVVRVGDFLFLGGTRRPANVPDSNGMIMKVRLP